MGHQEKTLENTTTSVALKKMNSSKHASSTTVVFAPPDPRLLNELPDELLIAIIFQFLLPKEIAHLTRVNRRMYRLGNDRVTLSRLIKKKYIEALGDNSLPKNFKLHPKLNWLEIYHQLPNIQAAKYLHFFTNHLDRDHIAKRNWDLKSFCCSIKGGYTQRVQAIIFKFLLQLCDDVDARDNNRNTLLMCAVKKYKDSHLEIKFIQLLLKAGAKLDLKNNSGKTVIEAAKSGKRFVISPFDSTNSSSLFTYLPPEYFASFIQKQANYCYRNKRIDEVSDLLQWKKSYEYWKKSTFFKKAAIGTGGLIVTVAAMDLVLTFSHVITSAAISATVLPIALFVLLIATAICAKHHYEKKSEYSEANAAAKLTPSF